LHCSMIHPSPNIDKPHYNDSQETINKTFSWLSGLTVLFLSLRGFFDCYLDHVFAQRGDLAAFQITSGVALFYVAILGGRTYYSTSLDHNNVDELSKLFKFHPVAHDILVVGFAFQFWDFFVSLLIEEHNTPIMLAHHMLAGTVCWLAVKYQFLQVSERAEMK